MDIIISSNLIRQMSELKKIFKGIISDPMGWTLFTANNYYGIRVKKLICVVLNAIYIFIKDKISEVEFFQSTRLKKYSGIFRFDD
ncbi:hypothetical protein BpHYR1_037672 [Brachionus plicatilis]|uniref:Uncharacterized protein n=1 Tax=Brachionus plicatilis TaxID=10195 RepID=A0A3M7P5R1_BRAPC|nr:hypothetical protein BpHYR1_037672 [Brachionus plicatilis]